MGVESDKTEVHQADNLKPADTSTEPGEGFRKYSVNVEGVVYAVVARTAEEAGEKAKKLHKSNKGNQS